MGNWVTSYGPMPAAVFAARSFRWLLINQDGLRDASPHRSPKPPGLTRILLVGDSFTLGAGNHYDEIWAVLLERRLAAMGYRIDVVKAGVAAYDTRREVLYLERLFDK